MRTVSVRELKSNPSQALRDARDGPVLVLNRGAPEALLVSVAGEQGTRDPMADAAEAASVIRGLAERHGARAVRAVDRSTTARRASERRTAYEADDRAGISLATLAATISAIAAPRRILRRAAAGSDGTAMVVVELDRPPTRAQASRLGAAAAAAGWRVEVRTFDGAASTEDGVVFDRSSVPTSSIDRLVADGRARPALRRAPFPPRVVVPAGTTAADEILRERDEGTR